MVKKGFLRKTGCILISLSLILTGWTFFGSSVSDAGLNAGVFTFDSETQSVETEYKGNADITSIEGEEGITASMGSNAFAGCSNLTTVSIKGNANVGQHTFLNDTNLNHFQVDGTANISNNAFQGCTNLGTFTVGSLSSFDKTAFTDCSALSTIKIDQSGDYSTYDGALYNGTTLIYVPSAKTTLTVRADTTAIEEAAFSSSNVNNLTFENAKNISSFSENQGSWPNFSTMLIVQAVGGAGTPIETFFNKKIEGKEESTYKINYGQGGSDDPTPTVEKYPVKVYETFYKYDGTTLISGPTENTSLSGSYEANTGIQARTIDGYTLTSANSPYTVTTDTNQEVTFTYKANSEDTPDPDPTPTQTYQVIVEEVFRNYNNALEGSRTNKTLSKIYSSGDLINATNYSGYALTTEGKVSPYTVNKAETIQFIYRATSKNSVCPINGSGGSSSSDSTKKRYTVTVYDVFYDAAATRVTKTTTRLSEKYYEGETYNYSEQSYTGYVLFDAQYQSGTVYADRTVKFFYKATSDTTNKNNTNNSKTAGNTKLSSQINQNLPGIYKITAGASQTVSKNGGPVKIVCNGELTKLTGIFVDGVRIDSNRYTLQSGSTILTFTSGFMKLFTPGTHTVRFEYTDGYAETPIIVTDGKTTTTVTYKVASDGSISSGHTKDATPKTADGFDSRYLLCIAFFLLGASAILFSKQKKLEAVLASERDEY